MITIWSAPQPCPEAGSALRDACPRARRRSRCRHGYLVPLTDPSPSSAARRRRATTGFASSVVWGILLRSAATLVGVAVASLGTGFAGLGFASRSLRLGLLRRNLVSGFACRPSACRAWHRNRRRLIRWLRRSVLDRLGLRLLGFAASGGSRPWRLVAALSLVMSDVGRRGRWGWQAASGSTFAEEKATGQRAGSPRAAPPI